MLREIHQYDEPHIHILDSRVDWDSYAPHLEYTHEYAPSHKRRQRFDSAPHVHSHRAITVRERPIRLADRGHRRGRPRRRGARRAHRAHLLVPAETSTVGGRSGGGGPTTRAAGWRGCGWGRWWWYCGFYCRIGDARRGS